MSGVSDDAGGEGRDGDGGFADSEPFESVESIFDRLLA